MEDTVRTSDHGRMEDTTRTSDHGHIVPLGPALYQLEEHKATLQTNCNHSVDMLTHPITNVNDDVIKWKHFPRYWSFVWGIHRSPVNSPHKSQWRGALMVSLICAWINGWANNRKAGDLRRHRAHYDVTVMTEHHCLPIHLTWGRHPTASNSTSRIHMEHMWQGRSSMMSIITSLLRQNDVVLT